MRGEISSGTFAKRHPYDWYAEEHWVTAQLIKALGGFAEEIAAGEAIWDPAAGFGATCEHFYEMGLKCFFSDIVQRVDWSKFEEGFGTRPIYFDADFRDLDEAPAPCSIVCNPPYSYQKGIAEAFARKALQLATRRVCLLLPNKWLSSQIRYRLFMVDHPPAMVLHLTQRPSMPPGDRIHLMGNRAFRGGMIDYCWIVWNVQEPTEPGETRTIWLPPLAGGC